MIILRPSLFVVLILSFQFSNAQISFQKSHGNENSGDYGHSVVESSDGSFYVAGVRVSQEGPDFIGEGLLMKTDQYGNEIWTQYYTQSGSNDLTFDYIELTSDNHLLVSGVVNYGAGDYDAYISKINLDGEVVWGKNYGGAHRQRVLQGRETADGAYIFAGWNEVNGNAGSISFYLLKTDENGDTLWTKTYPNEGMRQTGYAVAQNIDGGFTIAGSIQHLVQIGTDIFLLKTDATGEVIWTKAIDNPGSAEARDIVIGNNGNILISGWSAASGCASPILAEFNQEGDLQWINAFDNGFCEWNYSMCGIEDGGYALFGMNNTSDFSLINTNSLGIEKWTKIFDEAPADYGYCVRQTRDGGFVMCGINAANTDINISLIKTNATGVITNLEENVPEEPIAIFPNPAGQEISVELPVEYILRRKNLRIFNTVGQLIYSVVSENSKVVHLHLDAAIPGIHFLEIRDENGILRRQKLMLTGR